MAASYDAPLRKPTAVACVPDALVRLRPTPSQGRITFDGQDLATLPRHDRAALGIGYMPEDRGLVPELTVEEKIDGACVGIRHTGDEPILRNREHILRKGYIKDINDLGNMLPFTKMNTQAAPPTLRTSGNTRPCSPNTDRSVVCKGPLYCRKSV